MTDVDGRRGGGERRIRAVLVALAVVVLVVLLFTVVFPWFDATFVNDPVLGVVGAHGD